MLRGGRVDSHPANRIYRALSLIERIGHRFLQ
jgi:hypothetical protein